jgi:hypothetical protein
MRGISLSVLPKTDLTVLKESWRGDLLSGVLLSCCFATGM